MSLTHYQPYLDWLTTQTKIMETTLLEWSAINSGSYHLEGLGHMQRVLNDAFLSLETPIETITLAPLTRINAQGVPAHYPLGNALRLRKRTEAPYQVFLCGHMDTVYGAEHPFQTPKYLDKNTVNGPGVADMKGGLLVMLYALRALERTPFASQIGWEVLLNSDEEIGSYGSSPLLTEGAKRNQMGLIFEPAMRSDGTLAGARKGTGNFTVVARGRAAHAGRAPHLGRNAISALARFIIAADALNHQRDGVTVNVGRVEGGGATNIVPDLAIVYLDVRTKIIEDETWLLHQFDQILVEINQQEGIHLERHGEFSRRPKLMDEKTQRLFEWVRDTGKMLGLPIQWESSGGCCDGNNLAAAGLPVVDTLGVRGGNIHSADEYILLDSLVERAQLTALLLMRLATGDID